MIRHFHNYPIYQIPVDNEDPQNDVSRSPGETFDKSWLVYCQEFTSEAEKVKLEQILSSINVSLDNVLILNAKETHLLNNAIRSQKVTNLIIFDPDLEGFEKHPLNEVFSMDGTSILKTYTLGSLVQEEVNQQKARRTALWKSLQSWISK